MMIHSYLHSPFFAARFCLVPMLHLIFNLHTYSLVSALYWELSYYFSLAFEVVVRGVRMKTGWLGLCQCGRTQGYEAKGSEGNFHLLSVCRRCFTIISQYSHPNCLPSGFLPCLMSANIFTFILSSCNTKLEWNQVQI